MTSEELDKIFSCYTGYKIHKNVGDDEPDEFVKEILKGILEFEFHLEAVYLWF